MKYWVFSNKQWNYDDLEDETIRLFSSPDDFDFSSLEPVKEFVKSGAKGYFKYEKADNGFEWFEWSEKKHSPGHSMIYSSESFIWKDEFLEFLAKHYDVQELPVQPLIEV